MVNELKYRYFVEFSFNGSSYVGWQTQPNGLSVQEQMEHHFGVKMQRKVELVGCGRTDAGVHASFYVAHFDLDFPLTDPAQWVYELNKFLPSSIALKQIYAVSPEAHARFSALERAYEYHIEYEKNPFTGHLAWRMSKSLDVVLMNEAANLLPVYEDFSSFARSNSDVKHHRCKLSSAHFEEQESQLVFSIRSNRFLRNMVRAIVGTLVEVGRGNLSVDDFVKIIQARDRRKAKTSAPAQGLFLTEVSYPEWVYRP